MFSNISSSSKSKEDSLFGCHCSVGDPCKVSLFSVGQKCDTINYYIKVRHKMYPKKQEEGSINKKK